MKIIKPSFIIEDVVDGDEILKNLEKYGRTCYKSEGLSHGKKFVIELAGKEIEINAWECATVVNDYLVLSEKRKELLAKEIGFDYIPQVTVPLLRIIPASSKKFIQKIIESGHETILEHEKVTVRIICDRGVTHEIVRHRIASYSQESTRYCNYSNEKFGGEITFIQPDFELSSEDKELLKIIESHYLLRLKQGLSPQQTRYFLPNGLKTEIVMTMNLREWRHFFKLRCSPKAHPQMREITIPLLEEFRKLIPVVFDDIAF